MKECYTEKDKKQVVIQTIKNLYDTLMLYYNEEDIIEGTISFELMDNRIGYIKDYENWTTINVGIKIFDGIDVTWVQTQAIQFIPLNYIMSVFKIRKSKDQQWIPDIDIKKYLEKGD